MSFQPFKIAISQTELEDVQDRIKRTRWPGEIAGEGWKRGMPLDYTKKLAEYWRTKYDWREQEAKINEFPQFITEIDEQPVHFLHVRSSDPNAIPLILLHGYPSSLVEFLQVIDPLVSPAALDLPQLKINREKSRKDGLCRTAFFSLWMSQPLYRI